MGRENLLCGCGCGVETLSALKPFKTKYVQFLSTKQCRFVSRVTEKAFGTLLFPVAATDERDENNESDLGPLKRKEWTGQRLR